MAINIDTQSGSNRVVVDGEFTIYDASEFHDALKMGFHPDKDIEFDLSAVEEIDSSGLQLIAVYGKKVIANGAEVRFIAMSDKARDALEKSRLMVSLNCEEQESAG